MGRTPLATKIKSARLQAGLTQQQLADRIHCSRTAIADYERGRSEPDPERLAAIARATNVPLSYFLDAPVLLDGEAVQVLTPAQVLDIHEARPGPPPSSALSIARPEHWCDRIGAIIWVEVTPDSQLAEVYEPGTVLAVAHTNVVAGCKVLVSIEGELVVGELVDEGGRWRILTPGGDKLVPAGRHLVGSVVARIEAAAVPMLSERRRARRRRRPSSGGSAGTGRTP